MRITKRQLKRIIKEEYSKLKRQGLIREMNHKKNHFGVEGAYMPMGPGSYYDDEDVSQAPDKTVLDLASEPGGINLDELVEMFGREVFEKIDELEESGLIYVQDDGTVISLRGY